MQQPTAPCLPDTLTRTLAEGFNKVLDVDKAGYTVKVQAGLKVLDLMRWADANGMATAIGAPCNYAELTIGGVISANGHGTGSNVTSSLVRSGKGAAAGSSGRMQGRAQQRAAACVCREGDSSGQQHARAGKGAAAGSSGQ